MSKYIFTGTTAMKACKQFNKEIDILVNKEYNNCTVSFLESEQPVYGDYDLAETNEKLNIIYNNIANIKSAIRSFNMTEIGPKTGKTIDTILVLLPMLNNRKLNLERLRMLNKVSRKTVNGVTEYTHINYSLEEADEAYQTLTEQITDMQDDLNYLNSTKTFEVELED